MDSTSHVPWGDVAQWFAIVVTLFLAVFGEKIRKSIFKSKVDLEFKLIKPNCHKTVLNSQDGSVVPCYYLRIKVKSLNKIKAQNLELMLTRKSQKVGDEFTEDRDFLPLSLKWSHYGSVVLSHIPEELFRFCDFSRVCDRNYANSMIKYLDASFSKKLNESDLNVLLDLETEVKPNTGSSFIFPGTYRFELVLTGENIKKVKKVFQLKLANSWEEQEEKMFNNVLEIEEVDKI